MTLRSRFLLILSGVIIFALVAPLLVLYARGFKIDFSNGKVVKTGSLIVRTDPNKADIYLDGKKYDHQTHATIRFLLPQDYVLTIQKDGYQAWTKRLGIDSELVTWANLDREYLTLFFLEPQFSRSVVTQFVSKNPDNSRLVFVENGLVKFIDKNNDKIDDIGQSQIWNVAGKTLPINFTNYFYILSKPKLSLLLEELASLKKIETNSDFSVLVTTADQMRIYNNANVLVNSLDGVVDFHLENNNIWLATTQGLLRYDLRTNLTETIKSDLPLSNSYRIIRGDGNLFLNINNELYTLNDQLEKIYGPVTQAYWDNDSNKLVYSNDHEIFTFDSTKGSELILRSTTLIKDPTINLQTGYMFFGNEGKIKAIELDGRDHRNVYTLADAKDNFLVSKDGRLLHVYDQNEIKTLRIR